MLSDAHTTTLDQVKKTAICVYGDLASMDRMLKSMGLAKSDDPVMSLVYEKVLVAMGSMASARDLLCVGQKRAVAKGYGDGR